MFSTYRLSDRQWWYRRGTTKPTLATLPLDGYFYRDGRNAFYVHAVVAQTKYYTKANRNVGVICFHDVTM